jgi:3-oxoacyl-[acyl-carrier protein] reductase
MSRTVVITGATRGLGLSLAKRFVDAGDTVFGISLTKKFWDKAESVCSGRGHLVLMQADVSSETAVKKLKAAILKRKSDIDVLINNAGYGGKLATVDKLTLAEYAKFQKVNLTAPFLMCKYFLPVFQKQNDGFILNISSMAGTRAVPRLFGYSASKFGLSALTQCMVKENEDKKFKCFTICPGGMNTKMRSDLFGQEDANRQQSPDFVAEKIMDILENRMPVTSGSDVIIRHGKIWKIKPLPAA